MERPDPYAYFKFRVKWCGRYAAGMSKVTGLKKSTQSASSRGGGGKAELPSVTLERGVTHDYEFDRWANKDWTYANDGGQEASLVDFRKDVVIELYNEAGQKVLAYELVRCWVSAYAALPALDSPSFAVAIQSLELEHEGWERRAVLEEPEEPSF